MYLTGQIVGELTLLKFNLNGGKYSWQCRCACGNEITMEERWIVKRKFKDCGNCGYREKYPLTYTSWIAMNQRCNDKNFPDYHRYGGRGITIDPRWHKFSNFLLDMGIPPICPTTKQRYTLDRKDNDGIYTKDNCRWASAQDQNNNKEKCYYKMLNLDDTVR